MLKLTYKKFFLILMLITASYCSKAEEDPKFEKLNLLTIKLGSSYSVLNDKTIGSFTLQGIGWDMNWDYNHISENFIASAQLQGRYGFWNTYNFPSWEYRVGYNYKAKLAGNFMYKIKLRTQKTALYVGGELGINLDVNDIPQFVNSQYSFWNTNYLSPKLTLFHSLPKNWKLYFDFTLPILSLNIRPFYSVPLINYRPAHFHVSSFNDFIDVNTNFGFYYYFKNRSSIGILYNWFYKRYSYQNLAEQANHKLSFVWNIKL